MSLYYIHTYPGTMGYDDQGKVGYMNETIAMVDDYRCDGKMNSFSNLKRSSDYEQLPGVI